MTKGLNNIYGLEHMKPDGDISEEYCTVLSGSLFVTGFHKIYIYGTSRFSLDYLSVENS